MSPAWVDLSLWWVCLCSLSWTGSVTILDGGEQGAEMSSTLSHSPSCPWESNVYTFFTYQRVSETPGEKGVSWDHCFTGYHPLGGKHQLREAEITRAPSPWQFFFYQTMQIKNTVWATGKSKVILGIVICSRWLILVRQIHLQFLGRSMPKWTVIVTLFQIPLTSWI